MHAPFARVGLALALSLLILSPLRAIAEPEFFSDLPYGKAKMQAEASGKLFFVKATAVWCGPCKMMDRTTFTDQRVIDWLNEKAVCVSVDVDEMPGLAGGLRIRAMPTTILFRGDEELARVVGYRDADALLTWLGEAERGEIVPLADRPAPPAHDIDARLDRANELLRDGQHDAATEAYAWLWDNMLDHDPNFTGVRSSFMASSMNQLARAHPPAREAFTDLRDEAEDRLRDAEKKSWDDLRDWLVLTERVLGDREPIRQWIERIKHRPTAKRTFSFVDDIIEDMLIEEERWALYGSLINDPYKDIRMFGLMRNVEHLQIDGMDQAMRDEIAESQRRFFREGVAKTAAALLAAGREDEGRQVSQQAVETLDDPETRRVLVETALDAGELRAWHLDLLEGEALRRLRTKAAGMLSG